MKKLLVCILALILMATCLTSCDLKSVITCFPEKTPETTTHTEHTGEYVSFETGHQYTYTCGCPTPDILELHADHDENGKCDACGYAMGEHKHTTIMWFDENAHSWSYTCGCMTPPNAAQHADCDDDGVCDTCGYDGSLIEPGNVFLYGFEPWLRDLTAADVAKIRTTSEAVGVAPGSFKTNRETSNQGIIAKILSDYQSITMTYISKEDAQIDGGWGFTITFLLADGTEREIYFHDRVYDGNKSHPELSSLQYFRVNNLPTLDQYTSPRSYSFITYVHDFKLCDMDGVKQGVYYGLEDWKFSDEVDAQVYPEPTRYIDADVGKIYLCTDRVFYLLREGQKVYYTLVGDWTFADLEDYKIGFANSHSITYEDDRTAELLLDGCAPTIAAAGETVVLRTGPIMDADLYFYANGVKMTQTHADSDYWEYTFVMPDEDVVITHEFSGGW